MTTTQAVSDPEGTGVLPARSSRCRPGTDPSLLDADQLQQLIRIVPNVAAEVRESLDIVRSIPSSQGGSPFGSNTPKSFDSPLASRPGNRKESLSPSSSRERFATGRGPDGKATHRCRAGASAIVAIVACWVGRASRYDRVGPNSEVRSQARSERPEPFQVDRLG